MGRVGWSEIVIIMLIVLVVFGPNRLPEIARQVGRALREVRKVSNQFQDEVRSTLALEEDRNFPYMRPPPGSDNGGGKAPATPQPGPEPDPPGDDPGERPA